MSRMRRMSSTRSMRYVRSIISMGSKSNKISTGRVCSKSMFRTGRQCMGGQLPRARCRLRAWRSPRARVSPRGLCVPAQRGVRRAASRAPTAKGRS
eukprot:9074277-Lingulodinium_polyedra.AAC.1